LVGEKRHEKIGEVNKKSGHEASTGSCKKRSCRGRADNDAQKGLQGLPGRISRTWTCGGQAEKRVELRWYATKRSGKKGAETVLSD